MIDSNPIYFICYLILFQKDIKKKDMMVLIDSKKKVNTINPSYAAKLGLWVQKTDISGSKNWYFLFKDF